MPWPTIVDLFKAGPVAILAAGVWWEVVQVRRTLEQLTASVAVLSDRAKRA